MIKANKQNQYKKVCIPKIYFLNVLQNILLSTHYRCCIALELHVILNLFYLGIANKALWLVNVPSAITVQQELVLTGSSVQSGHTTTERDWPVLPSVAHALTADLRHCILYDIGLHKIIFIYNAEHSIQQC
jgi:hypothetical protein